MLAHCQYYNYATLINLPDIFIVTLRGNNLISVFCAVAILSSFLFLFSGVLNNFAWFFKHAFSFGCGNHLMLIIWFISS